MVPCKNENSKLDYDPWSGFSKEEIEWRLGQLNVQDCDPPYVLRKEEIEWRRGQHDKIHQRMEQAVGDLIIHSQRMRQHLLTDHEALRRWDMFMEHVQSSFFRDFEWALTYPRETPNSVLYEHLMKKKAHHQSFAGILSGTFQAKMNNIAGMLSGTFQAKMNSRLARAGALAASVAAAFAAGMTVESYLSKQRPTQET